VLDVLDVVGPTLGDRDDVISRHDGTPTSRRRNLLPSALTHRAGIELSEQGFPLRRREGALSILEACSPHAGQRRPLVVLLGDQDHEPPPDHITFLQDRFGEGVVSVPGSGHGRHSVTQERINGRISGRILAFLVEDRSGD